MSSVDKPRECLINHPYHNNLRGYRMRDQNPGNLSWSKLHEARGKAVEDVDLCVIRQLSSRLNNTYLRPSAHNFGVSMPPRESSRNLDSRYARFAGLSELRQSFM